MSPAVFHTLLRLPFKAWVAVRGHNQERKEPRPQISEWWIVFGVIAGFLLFWSIPVGLVLLTFWGT